MDDELREPLRMTRLVAWLAAGLLAAGVVSVGTVSARNDAENGRVVAAGQNTDGVELPPPLADVLPPVPPPVAPLPTTAPAPTTTTAPAPKPTAPPTTQPPRTTTTKAAVTATTATTPPTTAAGATSVTVNIVNEHPQAVNVKLNGRAFTLAPGAQSGPVTIARYDHGNDTVELSLVQDPSCGMGDADGYFSKGGSYRVAIVASKGLCGPSGVAGPDIKVTPA